jgi:protein SCO1/2
MSRRHVRRLAYLLVPAMIGTALGWYFAAPRDAPAPRPTGGEFALVSAAGPVTSRELRGKVVLLYFGYASCPDICPTALGLITMAFGLLGAEELERVRAVFVSVDPERDSPGKLGSFAAAFHPNVIGATADAATLAELAARYGAAYRKTPVPSAVGYVVDHSSYTYVLAPDGRLVETLAHGTPPEEIVRAVRSQL